jgi:hypothetical protein
MGTEADCSHPLRNCEKHRREVKKRTGPGLTPEGVGPLGSNPVVLNPYPSED